MQHFWWAPVGFLSNALFKIEKHSPQVEMQQKYQSFLLIQPYLGLLYNAEVGM